MEIKSILTNHAGEILDVTYRDVQGERDLVNKRVRGVHAYCFYQDRLVVVYAASKGYWTPPGGEVESGETTRDAVRGEVQEETNMRVLKQRFIGYQDISEANEIVTQTRSVCLVEPFGPFIKDPDGDITELKLIDQKEYKNYFDWGVIGDHLMQRALEIKAQMEAEIQYVS